MLNSVNNYNVLGKVGPHYERPEYRPPAGGNEGESPRAGDRRTLTKNGASMARPADKPPPPPVSAARLNLAGARNLAAALAAQISILPPQSTDREPHAWVRNSLLTPIYV